MRAAEGVKVLESDGKEAHGIMSKSITFPENLNRVQMEAYLFTR
jgi:hypothetical protein